MRLLLDTHALAWWVFDDHRLSNKVQKLVSETDDVFVSAVSAYEIVRKYNLGKWPEAKPLVDRFETVVEMHAFAFLPLNAVHALRAAQLPGDHRDPFDRFIAAQAIVENLLVLTVDPALQGLGADWVW